MFLLRLFLKRQAKAFIPGIKETLEELSHDPVPQGAKRIIESQEKLFRFRSRHLRMLYRVDYEKLAIVVIKIEPLSRMYH